MKIWWTFKDYKCYYYSNVQYYSNIIKVQKLFNISFFFFITSASLKAYTSFDETKENKCSLNRWYQDTLDAFRS